MIKNNLWRLFMITLLRKIPTVLRKNRPEVLLNVLSEYLSVFWQGPLGIT